MPKPKKKSKRTELPLPIKVKREKKEEDRTLQPMAHYIDDRLELVKQIFATLKPKTITNLAPAFLKDKSLDDIEELCLDELLCISKKRLLSVINATKCPSDTESSEDSDVQHEEPHISLEEISSDSEIEGKPRKLKKKKRKTNTDASTSKKNAKDVKEEQEPGGAMSVLELLELQARARAIRSQLAMEPVTKIEVDSDSDQAGTSSETKTKTNGEAANSRSVPDVKRVSSPKSKPNVEVMNAKRRRAERQQQAAAPKSRSTSPEVISIPQQEETFCISDSSEDEAVVQQAAAKAQSVEEPFVISEPEEGEVSEVECEQKPLIKAELTETSKRNKTEVSKEDNSQLSVESNVEKVKETASATVAKEALTPAPVKKPIKVTDVEDDVISLEGGDLESEMNEHLAADLVVETKVRAKSIEPREVTDDIILLNMSDEEPEPCKDEGGVEVAETWHSRYVKSAKVSQVLAASRLSKRVRDKIKQSKQEEQSKCVEPDVPKQPTFESKHEEGSIEQYKELLALEQKKQQEKET